MKTQKLRINSDYHLSDLINEIDKGDLRLPRFQRDYVWNRTKVIGLLDSIYNEFPIGSFFIWHADSRYRSLYKNIAELNLPEPVDERQLRYILDGQQRATSLYVAIKGLTVNGINYANICFDLETEQFINRAPNGKNLIALKDIVDRDKSLSISRDISDAYFETFQRCSSMFQQYPLSIVSVRDMELGNAIEIFERINKGGVRLGIFDLVVASTWSETFDLKVEFEKLKEDLKKDGFGTINPEIVAHSTSLILKRFCARAHQLSITSEELEQNWKEINTAIRQAINYLRTNHGVYTIEFMPYPSMLALVAYAFFYSKGRSMSPLMEQTVREWFWKSALTERYSASLEAKLGEDRRDIFDKALAGEEPQIGVATLNEDRIRSVSISARSAIRNAFFCMLALRQPRHFKTGAAFPIIDALTPTYGSIEKHHVFPRAFLRDNNIGSENLIANFCFIPAELNKEISHSKPSIYFARYSKENPEFNETLKTHLLSYSDAVKTDDYDSFLTDRSKSIFEQFQLLVGSKILRDLDGDANKVIDDTELAIRQLIAHKLAKSWQTSIPSKTRDKIQERLLADEKHTATTNQHITHLEQLRQLDISDYIKIIENNWSDFESKFEDMGLMKSRFNAFRRFRNDIKHSRTIDEVTQREGEAAVEWLNRCLQLKPKASIPQPSRTIDNDEAWYCLSKNAKGQATYNGNDLTVKAGSILSAVTAPSFESGFPKQFAERERLLANYAEKISSVSYRLNSDISFASPSSGSDFCLGRSSNGWTEWKNATGQTLDEIVRKKTVDHPTA